MIFFDPVGKNIALFLPFDLLLLCFLDEGMVQEIGPAQPVIRVFVEEPLQQILKISCDYVGVADGVLADVIDQLK